MTGPIRFLVSDVDGTLVTPDKTVTPAARDAVRALHDAGIGFAFVSSRPPGGLRSIADALGLRGEDTGTPRRPAAAAFNGGLLLDDALKPISFEPVPEADVRVALDLFESMGVDAWIFTIDEWLVDDPDGHYVAHERHTVGFDARVVATFDDLGPDVLRGVGKIVGSHPDPALLARAADALAPRLSTDARAALSQAYYLDVTHAKANKGSALRAIAAHAGLTLGDMAAIGDMSNDLAMLEIAGFPIAMGNAPDSVKQVAAAVTESNRDDGVREGRDALRAAAGRAERVVTAARHAVEVVPDAASLATRATEWLIEQIAHAIAKRDRAVLSLSGGTTPKAVFELLARPPWCQRVDWTKVHVFWGDERFVADGDPASNVRMTHAALLDHVDIPAAHVYPMPSDLGGGSDVASMDVDAVFGRAQSGAALYATTLHAFYGGDRLKDDRPFFDVVMLGLGEDGHTASLFPGTPALDEQVHWTAAVQNDSKPPPVRITMTFPLLQSTHAVLFLAAGDGKRGMLERVLANDESLPAARVHPLGGTLWIVDEAAAPPALRPQR